jgi:outer membrane protein OmpA-like peptidoglycan-associated protein
MRTDAMSRAFALAGLACLAALAPSAQAQFGGGDQDAGVYSMTILGIPVSPRAVALGEAMAAIDRDPSTIWYNAAGMLGLRTNAFTVNAAQRFAQTQILGAAVTFPTEIATFGIAARAFNAGTIEARAEGEPTGGDIRAFQWALEGGGAIQLARWWRWGGTLVFAQEQLGDETEASVGVNSGMQFPDVFFGRLTLAAGIRNWGTNVNFDEGFEGFSPPQMIYVGAGIDILRRRNLLQTPMLFRGQPIIFDAKLVGQVTLPDRMEPFVGLGIEGTVNGVAIGRIGYQTGNDNRAGISLGAGVNVGQFRLEYAFRNYKNGGAGFFENDPVGDAHNVSFTFFWGERERNVPVVPVVVAAPVDTGAINAAVRQAIQEQLAQLRPLLDSLRAQQVVMETADLVSRYIVPVHFGFDSAVVRESDMEVLGNVAEVIRRVYPTALVTIEGFADPAGTRDYNIRLSQRRANAVREVMITRFNLPTQQFRAVGYGEQVIRQIIPGAQRDQPGAQANRRVTFTIDATQRF